jgi:hypothetical protein
MVKILVSVDKKELVLEGDRWRLYPKKFEKELIELLKKYYGKEWSFEAKLKEVVE